MVKNIVKDVMFLSQKAEKNNRRGQIYNQRFTRHIKSKQR